MNAKSCTAACAVAVRALGLAGAMLAAAWAGPLHAQIVYVPLRDLDSTPLSTRAAGMGGASLAVTWGDQPDTWANPALVGLVSGIRTAYARDGEPGDWRAHGTPVAVGAWGLGFEHRSVKRTSDGELTSNAGGLSIARLLRGLGRISGHPSPWVDRIDAGFGFASREITPNSESGAFTSTLHDWGAYVRARPFHDTREPSAASHQVSVAYAHSVRNSGADVMRISTVLSTALPRVHADGVALHYAYRRGHGEGLPGLVQSPINAGLDPAVELTMAWDLERLDYGRGTGGAHERTHLGAELSALRIVSARVGWVDAPHEDVLGTAWGFGLALPVARIAGVRTDWAWEPGVAVSATHRSPSWSMAAWFDVVTWLADRPQAGGER